MKIRTSVREAWFGRPGTEPRSRWTVGGWTGSLRGRLLGRPIRTALAMSAPQPAADDLPVRLVARIVVDHAFQVASVWKRAFEGDYLSALVWPSIDLANTEYIFSDRQRVGLYLSGGYSDDHRRPISIRALSDSLDAETIRRATKRLVDRGLCRQFSDGVVAQSNGHDFDHIRTSAHRSTCISPSMAPPSAATRLRTR